MQCLCPCDPPDSQLLHRHRPWIVDCLRDMQTAGAGKADVRRSGADAPAERTTLHMLTGFFLKLQRRWSPQH